MKIFIEQVFIKFKHIKNWQKYILSPTFSIYEEDILLDTEVNLYLFGVLRCFQRCTGHIKVGSWKGRGNQYIQ